MTDTLSVKKRSWNMAQIKSKDTAPEMRVRRFLYSEGFRYRIKSDLLGKPDIVFRKMMKVVFIHGCFWHSHDCKRGNIPKSRRDYWIPKLERNKDRDKEIQKELTDNSWDVLVLWECEINNEFEKVQNKLLDFLSD